MMKHKSRLIAIIVLAMFIISQTNLFSFASQLNDLNGHWSNGAVTKWLDKGLVTGYPDGSFKPDNKVTRAEFITLVNKAFIKSSASATISFSDVKQSDWFYQSIVNAVANGYIKGYSDNTFRPNNLISREEAAVIMAKILNPGVNPATNQDFADCSAISDWAKDSVNAVFSSKVMNGYPDGTFKPKSMITRAEAVVALDLVDGLINSPATNPGTGGSSGGGGGGGGTPADTTPPTISITSPSDQPNFDTKQTAINLSGIATDNKALASVTYSVYQGPSGTATGTTNWTINNLDLLPGDNIITVTAIDGAGNKASDSITIFYDMGRVAPFDRSEVITDPETGQEVIQDQLLIMFKEEVSEETVNEKVYSINGEIVGYLSGLNEYQVKINDAPTLEQLKDLIIQLTEDSNIETVNLNYLTGELDATPNDPEWFSGLDFFDSWDQDDPDGKNWGLEAINAPGAWDYNNEMRTVRLGIMDGGFQLDHEDLNISPSNANGTDSRTMAIPDDYPNRRASYAADANGHGTHVAGIMGALANNSVGTTGVVWKRDLNVYRINLNSPVFEYKYGFYWLLEKGVKVINCSFGSTPQEPSGFVSSKITDDKNYWTPFIKRLINHGYDFIIVQSAGNGTDGNTVGVDAKWNGCFSTIDDPVAKSRIMIVGAVTPKFLGGYKLTNWSNYGSNVDIVAPGTSIYSTYTNNGYESLEGTSQAAPLVSGVIGLVWGINPNLTAPQVKNIIAGTADRPITKEGRQYKMVNAEAAVERARSEEATNPIPENSTGILMGKITDAQTGVGVSDASVSVFKGSDYGTYYASTVSDADGNYELILEPGSYKVFVSKQGYISTYSLETVTQGVTIYSPPFRAVSDSVVGNGTVGGTITNAFNGTGVPNLQISFREGLNVTNGSIVKITTTNAYGQYSVDLPSGNYTGEISGDGFVTSYFYVVSVGGTTLINQNSSVTPILPEGQTRIVLNWGETPTDLDSHLIGPAEEGKFHIYWNNQTYTVNDVVYADLDHDDITSYGPETTSIYNQTDGTYTFYVHDYTNRYLSDTMALSDSGAVVKIFRGNELIATYNVPANQKGNVWKVFSLNGTTLTPINEMSYVYPSAETNASSSMLAPSIDSNDDIFANLPEKK